MNITITGRHMEVTESIRTHATQGIEKLPRFHDRIQNVSLTLSVEGNRHWAEVVVTIPRGQTVIVSEESESMYNTLDLLMSKTERQLKKHKEKLKDHRDRERMSSNLENDNLNMEED